MNTLDTVLLIHLIIQAIFCVCYLLWQFDYIDLSEEAMKVVITILNVFETIVLVLSRFIPYSTKGVFYLGAWYVLNTILLILQFALADWGEGGWTTKLKIATVVWIGFYIFMFFNDVLGMNLIQAMFSSVGMKLFIFGETIQGTYWGDVLSSVIIVIVKYILEKIDRKLEENRK